jgi:hypothetical protein
VTLADHYPSPALAGFKKTWVFEIENVGSSYGCEAHEVSLSAQLTGQSIADFFQTENLGCHETAQITISAFVTIPFGQMITVTAHAQAGAAQGNTIEVSDTVDNPPPPTVPPTFTHTPPPHPLGDFNCDDEIDSIDAAIILQIEGGMIAPLPCTGDGDVNHDGELDSIDAALILQYTAGLITAFS